MRRDVQRPPMSEQSSGPGGGDAGPGPEERPEFDGGVAGVESTAGLDDPRVVGLESADAEAVLGAVASDTGRVVLEALHDDPATASGLADRLDASLQTVQYHLGNLESADLVEVVDTATSEKGREMDVYGPARRPVVVYAGDGDQADDLRSVLSRLVSGVALLGLVSLLVQSLFGEDPTSYVAETGSSEVAMTADAAGKSGAAAGIEPGLLFFAGGLVVLLAYLGAWYLHRRGTLDGLVPAR